MDYTSVINSLFIIFVLSIPGVVFRKLKMIDENQIKPVSSFMMKVILPAVIIYSMQTDFSKDMLIAGGKVFGSIFVLFFFFFIFSAILSVVTKNGKKYIGIITFLLFFANTGGKGIPVMNMLFGTDAVFYASAAEMAVDIILFTAGVLLMQSSGKPVGGKYGINVKEIFSPGSFAIVIGLILFLTNTTLPPFINGVLEKLMDASLAVTMFVIGCQIGGVNISVLKKSGKIFALILVAVSKLIIIPIIMYIIAFFVFKCGQITSLILAVLFGMPTGGAAAIFAQEYSADVDFAASTILLTDIFCLLTIPLLIVFIK